MEVSTVEKNTAEQGTQGNKKVKEGGDILYGRVKEEFSDKVTFEHWLE